MCIQAGFNMMRNQTHQGDVMSFKCKHYNLYVGMELREGEELCLYVKVKRD